MNFYYYQNEKSSVGVDVFIVFSTVLRQPSVKRAVGIPDTAHLAAPVTPAALATAVTLPAPPKRVKKNKR